MGYFDFYIMIYYDIFNSAFSGGAMIYFTGGGGGGGGGDFMVFWCKSCDMISKTIPGEMWLQLNMYDLDNTKNIMPLCIESQECLK